MIKTFACNETEGVWNGIKSKKIQPKIQNIARRKLRMINNSVNIADLRIPPANRLENLKGMYSIRINDKYRITFNWKSSHAFDVQIIDYHG